MRQAIDVVADLRRQNHDSQPRKGGLLNVTLSVPSKTFLTGEYAVLSGGESLVVNTSPRFELHVTSRRNGQPVEAYIGESPAGNLDSTQLYWLPGYRSPFCRSPQRTRGVGSLHSSVFNRLYMDQCSNKRIFNYFLHLFL